MFIKLTKLDGRPVWLNASFIVTVEPRRDGNGAVVVPIGDGLDYDVKETPETVLKMLEGAPVPTVVPVPVSDCLTKTPVDVSPEPEPKRESPRAEEPPAAKAESADEKPVAEKKPRRRTTKAKKTATKGDEPKTEEKPSEKPADEPAAAPAEPPKVPALELAPDQVARLAKLAPKSIAKLKNTLATQFHIADVGGTVLALEAKGAFTLEGNRVIWPAPLADW